MNDVMLDAHGIAAALGGDEKLSDLLDSLDEQVGWSWVLSEGFAQLPKLNRGNDADAR
jgi:hypothetical protein